MKPEELKIIAEGMGYELRYSEIGEPCNLGSKGLWIKKEGREVNAYNPLTNDTQCMEIMEKLQLNIRHLEVNRVNAFIWMRKGLEVCEEGKTIKEAVCKAALEYFK